MRRISLEQLEGSSSKHRAGGTGKPGVLNIVWKEGSRRSVSIAEEVIEELGSPLMLAVYFDEDGIVFEALQEDREENCFRLKHQGKKGIIYSKSLVEEIIETYDLDFESRTSRTFFNVEYFEAEAGSTVAKVVLVDEEENDDEEEGSQ